MVSIAITSKALDSQQITCVKQSNPDLEYNNSTGHYFIDVITVSGPVQTMFRSGSGYINCVGIYTMFCYILEAVHACTYFGAL